MLRFIYGTSGSGKTTAAVNILTELCKSGEERLLMLVPDQSSFETETRFLDLLGAKLSRNIKVFGFSRLSEYVFEQEGKIPQNVIDDGLRRIIMSEAIRHVESELDAFSPGKVRKSVLELMLHSLKECKKNNITPDMLTSLVDVVESESLRRKLTETALVLEAYDALLSQTYVDPLDNLTRLADILGESRIFEGYTIVVDSFSGFTHQQLCVLEVLMRECKDIYITLNIDPDDRYSELFTTTNNTRRALRQLASANNTALGEPVHLTENHRIDREDISFLEKYMFRINEAKYDGKPENIVLYRANSIYREADYIAAEILRLVTDFGYSFSDIAVVCRDITPYKGVLDNVFEKLDIPYFMDVPRDIFTKPAVRFITSAIDCVLRGFERESLLSMLKTGVVNLDETEIADLENYLYLWAIDRSALKQEFTGSPEGFDPPNENTNAKLGTLEATRVKIIEPLINFSELSKENTALEISEGVYSLMEQFGVGVELKKLYDKLCAEGMTAQASEEIRVYNLAVSALDRLNAAIGDRQISLKEYRENLNFILEDIKFSEIPRFQDQVEVGTADKIRLTDVKAVFVLGAIDGVFPSVPTTVGAFSESERRTLIENRLPLTDSLEELAAHEKYLTYCVLSSPSERLYVSYYTSDFSGNGYNPSIIVSELGRLFDDLTEYSDSTLSAVDMLYSRRQAFDYLARRYTENQPTVAALEEYFDGDGEFSSTMEKLDAALEGKPFRIYNRSNSERLFGKHMKISASQLEKYHLCPFGYFCNYGLRAKERKVAEIDSAQFGTIVHYFLEKFLKRNKKSALNTLTDEDIHFSIDEILDEYAEESFGGLEDKPKSFVNQFERLKSNIFNLAKEIIRQLGSSDFVPFAYELQIGDDGEIPAYRVELDDEHSVSLRGYVDRMDICEKNDDEVYVRVVDYKTGNKEFKLSDILYGVNMQMLLYLNSVSVGGEALLGKKPVPAGVLYMPSKTETIDGRKYPTEEAVRKQMDSNFRMNGLILNDPDVIEKMDHSGKNIKLTRKAKDDDHSQSVADKDEMRLIFAHIDETVREMGKNLQDGRIAAVPLKGIADGCAYCPYDSVCCREGGAQRYGTPKNVTTVYDTIRKELNEDE